MSIDELVGSAIGLERISEIGEGYAIVITSVLVIISWFITRRGQIISERNLNTQRFNTILEDKELGSAIKDLRDNINGNISFGSFPLTDRNTAQPLSKVLHSLEKTCASIRVGFLSERYIDLIERSFIHNIFRLSYGYIEGMREHRNTKTFYENLEIYYIRSFVGKKSLKLRLTEFILCRPCFGMYRFEFNLNRKIMKLVGTDVVIKTPNDWFDFKKRYSNLIKLKYFTYFLILLLVSFST